MSTIDLTNVSALSVDLFDTLLLRAVANPIEVFERVGALAREREQLRPHITPGQFRALRQGAEAAARLRRRQTSDSTEVTLPAIYAAMPAGVIAAAPATLAGTELQVESALVYPHPGTLDTVLSARARGVRVAILSDTCYGADDVRQLLRGAGIDPSIFDQILTSSDEDVSKFNGGLFARLLARWPGLAPSEILHIGDHPRADVTQARAVGLRVFAHDTGEAATREVSRLESLRYGSIGSEIYSLRRLAVSLAPPIQDDERWWFTLGASVLGPLCATFADWVVEGCVRDGITIVRPLMREGGLLSSTISRAADAAGVDLDVRPLYASRASTWLAGIAAFDDDSARRLLQRQQLTVREAFATLGLRVDDAPDSLRSAGNARLHTLAHTATGPGSSIEDELLTYFARSSVRAEVDYHAARARELLTGYVGQECGTAGDVALVDIGFHGRIGLSLERSTGGTARRFVQFMCFGADSVRGLWARGHDIRLYGAGPGENADLAGPIVRYPAVLEALLMEGGTTLGYRRSGDRVVPVLDESLVPDAQQAASSACRRGIAAFQERWLDWRLLRSHAARTLTASPRAVVEPLHRLLTMPTLEEASRLGALLHEDNDGGVSVRAIAGPSQLPSEISAQRLVDTPLASVPTVSHELLWPAGTCEQRWPGAIERQWRQAAGTMDGAPSAIPAVAMKVREAGVRQCVVWGAGESGAALVNACRMEGIEVHVVTDSNPALWGSAVEGVPVVSPEEARLQGTNVYAIGSLAFASDIELALKRRYVEVAQPVRVFSATHEVAA